MTYLKQVFLLSKYLSRIIAPLKSIALKPWPRLQAHASAIMENFGCGCRRLMCCTQGSHQQQQKEESFERLMPCPSSSRINGTRAHNKLFLDDWWNLVPFWRHLTAILFIYTSVYFLEGRGATVVPQTTIDKAKKHGIWGRVLQRKDSHTPRNQRGLAKRQKTPGCVMRGGGSSLTEKVHLILAPLPPRRPLQDKILQDDSDYHLHIRRQRHVRKHVKLKPQGAWIGGRS